MADEERAEGQTWFAAHITVWARICFGLGGLGVVAAGGLLSATSWMTRNPWWTERAPVLAVAAMATGLLFVTLGGFSVMQRAPRQNRSEYAPFIFGLGILMAAVGGMGVVGVAGAHPRAAAPARGERARLVRRGRERRRGGGQGGRERGDAPRAGGAPRALRAARGRDGLRRQPLLHGAGALEEAAPRRAPRGVRRPASSSPVPRCAAARPCSSRSSSCCSRRSAERSTSTGGSP
ncbi:MAG: hypothetical protein M5U28_37210 [Sandaracinaceae bacterium]|nr:hypothetical protein [Sandaracinaceae bacterium]